MADLFEIAEQARGFSVKRVSGKLKPVFAELDRRARKISRVEFRIMEREGGLPSLSPDEMDDDAVAEVRSAVLDRWADPEVRGELLADLPGTSATALAEETNLDAMLAHLYLQAFEANFLEMLMKKLTTGRGKKAASASADDMM